MALAVGLLVLVVYAVFAHGAIQSPAEPRVEVAAAALAALTVGALVWSGTLRLDAPRAALIGLALMAAFAAWSAVSLAWTVAPDLTWAEFNRVTLYVIVLGLAIVLGASTRRAVTLVTVGFFVVILAVTAYALGQKMLPGFHVGSLINLNQTGKIPRLQEPLGYWNALALLLAMGAPVALAAAARPDSSSRARLLGVISLQLVLIAGCFTYSRGGIFALVVALAACVVLSGSPLRLLTWLLAAVLAATPALVLGLTAHALSGSGVALAKRESAGLLLLVIVIATSVVLGLVAERVCQLERTVSPSPETIHRIKRGLAGGAAAIVVLVLLAVTFSSRGLTGTISHMWHSFTATRGISTSDPNRIFSADSANRWVWWKEAAGAFWSRPLSGWGAGSFPVVHLLFRRDTLSVNQPHSVPLQWLCEDGLIGAALALGAWVLLLWTATVSVRRRHAAPERLLAGALLAGAVAYSLHAFYDWDWDIPGVTLPAVIVLGVLAGSLRSRAAQRVAVPDLGRQIGRPGPGAKLLAVGAAALALCMLALSAVLPGISASHASAALVRASSSSASTLSAAENDARLANRLDPLSDSGLRAEALLALHYAGGAQVARGYLLQALRRDPSDEIAWDQLAVVDAHLDDLKDVLSAAQRVVDLDPLGQLSTTLQSGLVQTVFYSEAPPAESATAIQTPTGPTGAAGVGVGVGATG
jgi:hypothetical protein